MALEERHMRSDSRRNHEAILGGAIAVLAQSPGASMREIADASGTGRTTLYRHFPDRAALVLAIYERSLADAEQISAHWLRGDGEPLAVLVGMCVELAGLGDQYRFLERHEATLAAHRDPADIDRRSDPLLRYMRAAQRSGAIRADLDAGWLLRALIALITAAASDTATDPERRGAQLSATVRGVLTAG